MKTVLIFVSLHQGKEKHNNIRFKTGFKIVEVKKTLTKRFKSFSQGFRIKSLKMNH